MIHNRIKHNVKNLDIAGILWDGVAFIILFPLIALWSVMLPALIAFVLAPVMAMSFLIAAPVFALTWIGINVLVVYGAIILIEWVNRAGMPKAKRKNDHR